MSFENGKDQPMDIIPDDEAFERIEIEHPNEPPEKKYRLAQEDTLRRLGQAHAGPLEEQIRSHNERMEQELFEQGSNNMTHDLEELEDDRFGICPYCLNTMPYINIGSGHWFYCEKHKLRWYVGSNLFSSWQDETEEQQRKQFDEMDFGSYRQIIPFHLDNEFWLKAPTDLSPEQRYVIERDGSEEGYWGIHDRCADPDTSYYFFIEQIETREEAEEILGKVIRGEQLRNKQE
jgi:hypothetical protein